MEQKTECPNCARELTLEGQLFAGRTRFCEGCKRNSIYGPDSVWRIATPEQEKAIVMEHRCPHCRAEMLREKMSSPDGVAAGHSDILQCELCGEFAVLLPGTREDVERSDRGEEVRLYCWPVTPDVAREYEKIAPGVMANMRREWWKWKKRKWARS